MQIDQYQDIEISPGAEQRFTLARYTVPHAEHPERNEDTILVERRRGLVAVFDGVGGREHGDVASRTAARSIRAGWRRALAAVQPFPGLLTTEQELDVPALLRDLVEEACLAIRAKGERSLQEDGSETITCGETTMVLAVLCLDPVEKISLLHYAHAGDSRIYLLPQGKTLCQLTRDDSYFTREINKGLLREEDVQRIEQASLSDELTDEEKELFKKRNGITRSLGPKKVEAHVGCTPLSPGDRVLLCTDGLHDNLTDNEIEDTLRRGARTTIACVLVQQAIARSQEQHFRAKKDDMSAVVVTHLA